MQSYGQEETPRLDYIDSDFHYQRPSDCIHLPPPPEPKNKPYGDLLSALGLGNSPTWDFPVDVTLDSPLDEEEVPTPSTSSSELPEIPTIMVTAPSSEPASPLARNGFEERVGLLTTYYSPSQGRKPRSFLQFDDEETQSGYEGGEYDEDDIVLSEVRKSLQLSKLAQPKARSERVFTGKVMRLFSRDR
jgi:hypothetical protein